MQGRELKVDDFPAVWENEPTSLSKLSVRGIWPAQRKQKNPPAEDEWQIDNY